MPTSATPETWVDRVRDRMSQLGVSQATLAVGIGATRGRVGHYLRGRNEPPLSDFMLICRFLRVSADWVLFGGAAAPLETKDQLDPLARQLADLDPISRRDIEAYLRVRKATKDRN